MMTDGTTIFHVRAPAKLTTSLRVTGVREDGLHLIDAEMVTLDLHDELTVDPAGSALTLSGRSTALGSIDVDDNLVLRALELAGVSAAVELTKHIPAGAGLGGGSADAAAILRWAGFEDEVRAASIGADVAFCLVGGRARVTGIGEVVEPLAFIEQTFTLLTPPIHCSTPVVYAMWDRLGGPRGDGSNDLEPAALAAFPDLVGFRREFEASTGETPQLAGSGSSWFVRGRFPEAGRVVVAIPSESQLQLPHHRA